MYLNDQKINDIVEKVVERIGSKISTASSPQVSREKSQISNLYSQNLQTQKQLGVFDSIDDAVIAAKEAFDSLSRISLENREIFISAMRKTTITLNETISKMAVDETGLGRVEDKLKKNYLVATKTPGTEILRPIAYSGDHGLSLVERAPYGIIGAITPCTNPTETILCNAIGMIAGGNTVVFNVHPAAKNLSRFFINQLNQAISQAGGPKNLLSCVAEPSIESANALMKHKGVRLIVVTGGGAVVQAAMTCGKRAIAAGPGNPPVIVDETANIEQAAVGIINGVSFDNNIICTDEKEVIAVSDIADLLKRRMIENGAVEIKGHYLSKLEKLLITDDNHLNREWIGKDASKIADAIGLTVPKETRLLFAEADEKHPFVQHELLMPVIGFVRVSHFEEAADMAKRVEHGFGHTASIYSTNIAHLHHAARLMNVSIFIKNAPNYTGLGYGGEGYTSFTIASPTGEGLTTAISFTRERRCTLVDYFRIV